MKTPIISMRVWDLIAWNFIMKLPELKDSVTGFKYDVILIITDHLSKYTYFISFKEIMTTEDLACIFISEI